MSPTLTVDVGDEERVFLVPRHDGEFATVGTVAEVVDHVRLPGGGHAAELMGLHRGIAGAARTGLCQRLTDQAAADAAPPSGRAAGASFGASSTVPPAAATWARMRAANAPRCASASGPCSSMPMVERHWL